MTQATAQPAGPVGPSMTVAEINRQFPQCAPVFEKYGIAGCGGQFGPPEPLFIFAAAHHVPLKQLVDELNQAVRGEWKEPAREAGAARVDETRAGETLYKQFIAASLLLALTAGFTLGVINMTRIALDQSYHSISGVLKQVHGHAQIFGWVGLFVMGVAFHAVPRFKMAGLRSLRAAKACLVLMTVGVVLRSVAQPFAANRVWSLALPVSALMELAAIGMFVWLLVSVIRDSSQRREFYDKFIIASLCWFVGLGILNLWMTLRMFTRGYAAAPATENIMFIHAALFGFIANMIFGFSLRVLPHFLGLRDARVWAANAVFILWNLAVLFRIPFPAAGLPFERMAQAATVLEMASAFLFVWALGIFARRKTRIEISGVDNTFAWFIYLGYAWLLITAVLPLHADIYRLTGASRHAMTVGFVTSILMGVAYRVLPIFNGVKLHSNRLMRVSFWHLAAGSTLSLAMAFSNVYENAWTFAWAGATGYLVLAAVGMFSWNLLKTLLARAEQFTRDSIVTLQTRVTELLEVWPDLRSTLIHGGLGGLAAMRHNPPRFVTLEFAARRHGIDPGPLVQMLNEEIQKRKGSAERDRKEKEHDSTDQEQK